VAYCHYYETATAIVATIDGVVDDLATGYRKCYTDYSAAVAIAIDFPYSAATLLDDTNSANNLG